MNERIDTVAKAEYPDVVAVWEASVRATHHFLEEKDIQFYKPLILNQYLGALDLACVRGDEGKPVGFVGVAGDKIEMLFIDPAMRGKGIGKSLLTYAVSTLAVTTVDVNEANEQAVGFYRRMEFQTTSRSERDSMGKPFPLLHMELVQ
jgi:putative acetyltransferase